MKREMLLVCLTVALTGTLYGQGKDSSDLIFVDSVIHTYELKYYISNWADSMKVNKEKAGEAYMPAQLIYRSPRGDSVVLDSIGVRYKGNSSYELSKDTPKKSFKFSFGEYRNQTFFGCERLNLNNNVLDPSQMREKISYDLARKYMPAPRAAYATLSINGALIGVYTQVEQIDELFLKRNYEKSSGNLYKVGDNGAGLEYKDQNQKPYEAYYELKTNTGKNDWSNFISMLYKLNATDAAKFTYTMKSCLNLDNCVKYLAWTIALSNFDSYTGSGRNYYVYDDPKNGQFSIIPWDNNMSFGLYLNAWNMITNSPVNIGNKDQRPLTKRILENDSLKMVYLGYLQEMINGPISDVAIAAEADRLFGIIDSAVEAEPAANAFFPYEKFLENLEGDVEYKDGFSNNVIAYGIKSFPLERNEQLAKQIEAGVTFHRAAVNRVARRIESSYNAAAGKVTVHFAGPAAAAVRVAMLDARGRIVASTSISGKSRPTAAISTTGLVPGVYSVVVTSGAMSLTDRVIVTK